MANLGLRWSLIFPSGKASKACILPAVMKNDADLFPQETNQCKQKQICKELFYYKSLIVINIFENRFYSEDEPIHK